MQNTAARTHATLFPHVGSATTGGLRIRIVEGLGVLGLHMLTKASRAVAAAASNFADAHGAAGVGCVDFVGQRGGRGRDS